MELNNLQNITLRVAINHTPPFTSLQWDSHRKKWIGIGGFEVKLIEAISQYLNFTYEFINCNNVWGTLSSNGSWNGIIGLLVNKDADIGISGISLSMDRSKAVKYLYPHLITDVTFITTQPQEKTTNIYLAFKPFSINVWIGLFLSIFTCFLFDKLYNRLYSKRYVTKVFWFSIYSMLRQQYFIPKSDKLKSSLNIWLINWSLATFVLTTAYGGYLVSLAAIPNEIKTIDTVDELAIAAKSNEVIVTSLKHSSHTRMLINSEFKLYSQLGHLLKNVDVVNDAFKLVSSASGTRKAFSFIGNSESLRIAQLTFGEKTIHMPPQNGYSSMFINMVIVAVRTNFEYFNEFNSM